MTTTSDAHADRETEAAIRKRIADEVRDGIKVYALTHQMSNIDMSFIAGMIHAKHIVYGTGVAGEGEQG